MEVALHRKSHFGTQNNVRLQRYVGLPSCRIRQYSHTKFYYCDHMNALSQEVQSDKALR